MSLFKKFKALDLALEPRTMFDAAFAVDIAEQLDVSDALDFSGDLDEITPVHDDSDGGGEELYVIDSRVENADAIIEAAGPDTLILRLDTSESGFAQIEAFARDNPDLSAIHIFGHGGPGFLLLGDGMVTAQTMLDNQADSLKELGETLGDDADILIYGCNFADGEAGKSAATIMAALTGAEVAASTDATGDAAVGGDWTLEFQTDVVETDAVAVADFSTLLAVEATDGIFTVQDSDTPAAGTITLSDDGAGFTTTNANTPRGVQSMVQQVWTYGETADVGESTIVINVSAFTGNIGTVASDFALVISDQADLSLPATTVLRASGYDAVNGLVYFHKVNLADGAFVSVATRTETDNISIDPVIVVDEEGLVDLNLAVQPALTDGGSLPDTFATAVGFRPSNAGSTPTDFLIPAGTTNITITGNSSFNAFTGSNATLDDDFQNMSVSIDLSTGTSSGYLAYVVDQGPSRNDQFSWSDVPLGTGVLDGGTTEGNLGSNINPVFSIVDGQLQIVENTGFESAYLVEFATTLNTSSNFIGSSAALQDLGDQSDIVIDIPAGVDYIKINQNDAAAGSNSRVEYKGYSSHFLDLSTASGSGSIMAQQGSGNSRTVTYGYDNYDFASGTNTSIQSSGADVIGDTTSTAAVNNDLTYYVDGNGDLVISRASAHANGFNSMFTVEFYDRLDVGSSADNMGNSSDSALFDATAGTPDAVLSFEAPEGATLGLLNLSMGGTSTNNLNENMGSGFVIINLETGVTSGSMFSLRASSKVDLLSWANVPEGTNMFDVSNGSASGGTATSNHGTLAAFNDKFIPNGVFEIIANADGTNTVEFITNSSDGTQSFRDYNAFANVQWLGSEPIKLTGLPEGGSFNIGELNPVTGDWEIDIAEAAANGLTFTPPEHFSGNLPLTLNVSVGPESDDTLIIQRPVLDPISFDTTDATGDEDTQISLSAAVTPTFVDDDGSETITSTLLSGVTVGHTITDGTNTFTATSGAQSVDVSSWDTSALTYFAGENVSGQFDLTVVVNYQDTGAGQTVSGSSSDTLTVNVLPVNDAPDAVDDQYILINGQTLVTTLPGVLSNDSDVENDTLTVQTLPVSGPSHGILTLNGDGSFIYVNSGDGSPTDQFTYSVSDGNGGVSTATVVLTIAPAPVSPPDANDDAVSTNEETPVTIAVLDNDQPTDAPVPIVQSVTQPANGAVVINANGTVTYTPDENFFTGTTDSFTYTIVDALDRTDTATVIVTVNNVQDAPTALPDSATTPEDVSVNINVLANDNDVDGDTLTIASATSDQGAVSIEIDGTLTFVPNANFSGPATINYTISDGNGNSVSSTVAVTVTAQPDAPDSADKTITIAEDSIYTLVTSDFVFSDGDDGDSLQYIDFQAPSVGTLSLNGVPLVGFPARVTLTQLNGGALTYQPETDGTGTAYATVDFLVSDGQLSDTAANTITFDVTPVDDPIALSGTGLPDQTLVDGETGVSLQTAFAFSDVDDVVATYALNGAPLGLQINANTGEITSITGGIDHLASNDSPFTATVTATSADGSSISTSFLIAVTNPAPVSTPGGDFEYNDSEVIVPIDIAALFSDPDLDSLTYALESGTLPENLVFDAAAGVLSGAISNAASTLETYTATFRATDEQGRSTTSSISFTINNPEPSLVTQIPNQNNFDGDVIDVAAGVDLNDFIQDDDALTFTVTGLPAGLTYDPATDIISGTLDTSASTGGVDGSYAITVVATDAQGRDTEANFTWNVVNLIPVIDAPIADQEAYDGDLLSFPLTDVFSDPDMDGLTFSVLVDDPAIGTVTLSSASGSPVIEIDVAPSASQTNGGIYLLTITADDGEGGATSELVQITISNPPPVIETLIPDQDSLDVDVISLDVSANFADVDGDTVTFSATGLASLGLSIDANGLISGTIAPSASQNSPYPITITATDADGGVGEYSFVWTVINPVPTAGTIPTQVAVDGQSVSFDAATAGGFADEDVLAYAVSGLPAGFAIDANGVITGTFSNAASTNAPYTVSVTATDNEGGTVVRSFTWSVTNPAPQTSDLPDQAARDGDTVAYDIAASFADTAPDTDLLSFSTTSPLPAGLSLSATGQLTGTLDHLASDGSPYVITVTATDAQGATINNSFTLTVTNPAPVVAAGGIADIVANDAANVMVNAGRAFSDPDGDLLVFDGEGLPAGLEINPATGVITGTLQSDASQSGPYLITVTSTDSQGSQTQVSFFLTALNTPVTAVSIPNATVNLGQEFPTTGADVFSDLDGDELFITAVNLPDGLQIDSQTGVISGSIAKTVQPGDYRVAVTATDSEGGTVSVSFVITVPEQGTRTPENFVSDSYQSDPLTETQHNDPTQGTRQTASTVLLDALEQIQSLGLMVATGLDTPILDTNDQLDALQRQLIDVQTPNFTNTFPIILELSEGEAIASDFTANVLIGTNRVFYNIETVSGVDLELDPEFAPAGVFIASEGGIVVERWVSEPFVVIVKTINGDEATYSEVRIDPQQNQFEIIATEVRKLLISERLEWQPSIY